MEEFLVNLQNNLFVFYSLALLASVYISRKITSFTITIAVVVTAEICMISVRDPVLLFARQDFNAPYKYMIWYSFWATCNVVIVGLIYKLHMRLKIKPTQISKIITFHYVALCMLQLVGFANKTYIHWHDFDLIYQFGIPSINISIACVCVYFILKELLNVKRIGPNLYG